MRDPGVYTPPLPPLKLLTAGLDDVVLRTAGADIKLGRSLQSAPFELTMLGASTLTLNVIDRRDELWDLLDLTEDRLLDEGVTATVGGWITRLSADQQDGTSPKQMTFVDDVSWRMGQFSSPLKFSRGQYTRAQAIYRMADEARQPPLPNFDIFIPELNDLQRIAKPTEKADGTAGGDPGFADDADITVKGVKATKKQRTVLGEALAEAHSLKAADRVMTAVVMALIQESLAGEKTETTGDDDTDYLQQGREWITAANAHDVRKAVRAFLLGYEAGVGGTGRVKGWKQRFGSLRHAPGDLDSAIKSVQISAGGYGPWETEAKRIVKAWNPAESSFTGERDYAKTFEFTRGTSDGREDSWTATGRLVDEINGSGDGSWHRWACLNAFGYASDEELRQARPSLTVRPGAPWLLNRSYQWNVNRPITELTLSILASAWGLLPGSVVAIPDAWGPLAGRWLVRSVRGQLGSKQVEVTLTRPMAKRPEPAHDTEQRSDSNGDASDLKSACSRISGQNRAYKYGGGHGKPLASIGAHEALDCSSSVSLALRHAGMLDSTTALTSGEFASSWGKPGKGKRFTVWARSDHVWIEGYKSEGSFAWRFDTSPYGTGKSGPHVRNKARNDQARFTPRHWPGS